MSSSNAMRWIAVVASATLGIGDLVVLDVIAAPAWVRSRDSSNAAVPTPATAAPPAEPARSQIMPLPQVAVTATASATEAAATPAPASASVGTVLTTAPPAPTGQASPAAPATGLPEIEAPHFGVGSSEIGDKARPSLLAVASQLKSNLGLSVLLRGHTDAAGEESFNEHLSLQRARAAQEFLVTMGVARDRITVAGLGAREPIDPADTLEARARNRRVEIVWKP